MAKRKYLPGSLLEDLQSTYENFPDGTASVEDETQFDSGLRELIGAYGADLILQPGEIPFFSR